MRPKILSIDDSKTVRLIIRKTFKPFDCEVFEAANGVEGLALAAKVQPSLILLDVTMPVMDGVEMLTRLKADPALKDIPVVMLTAEGGRDIVVSIAKLGVRGYVVKPFKEETMVEKASAIIELKPAAEAKAKPRSVLDPLNLLVVDDKPTIIQQIEQGLSHTPWKIQGVGDQAEALKRCEAAAPDIVVISLSLPGDAGVALLRALRAHPKTKFTPLFALVVKTDSTALAQAQQLGFNAVVTKPIIFPELETRVAKALSLDTSAHFFRHDGQVLIISLPENASPAILLEASEHLAQKLAAEVDAGLNRVVIDLHAVRSINTELIRLMMQAMQTCRELTMQVAVIGNPQLATECQGFEETSSWVFHDSLEAAKAHLGAAAAPQPAAAG